MLGGNPSNGANTSSSMVMTSGIDRQQTYSGGAEYEYTIPAGKGDVNTSASNIITGGTSNTYNVNTYLSSAGHENTNNSGMPQSRGIATRKMMAAVNSGFIEETSPHSSKHELIVPQSLGGQAANQYRKRF